MFEKWKENRALKADREADNKTVKNVIALILSEKEVAERLRMLGYSPDDLVPSIYKLTVERPDTVMGTIDGALMQMLKPFQRAIIGVTTFARVMLSSLPSLKTDQDRRAVKFLAAWMLSSIVKYASYLAGEGVVGLGGRSPTEIIQDLKIVELINDILVDVEAAQVAQ